MTGVQTCALPICVLVDAAASGNILGYNLDELFDSTFAGTPGYEEMKREYRAFLPITADKSSQRRTSELVHRYVNALARSPKSWFRLRCSGSLYHDSSTGVQ